MILKQEENDGNNENAAYNLHEKVINMDLNHRYTDIFIAFASLLRQYECQRLTP